MKLLFEYDWQGRRIRKDVLATSSISGGYSLLSSTRFVYDGWNLLGELDGLAAQQPALLRSYTWGLDLSGSIQGAGGVGGLLVLFDSSTINNQPSSHFACLDGSGNVAGLVNAIAGTNTAVCACATN